MTYSPENLLMLARLIAISQKEDEVIVQPISRPGTSSISFGGVLDSLAVEEEEEEEVEHETFTWQDIIDGEWRLVPS